MFCNYFAISLFGKSNFGPHQTVPVGYSSNDSTLEASQCPVSDQVDFIQGKNFNLYTIPLASKWFLKAHK